MNFGSLFAGIGGIDLGLERAGMTCEWQVEIDDYCNKVLEKHWPNVERFKDVEKVGSQNLRAVDLIAGGFPCQDVSLAGKREGLSGERSGLWSEFARIICELKPRWVLVENVPGLYSTDNGDGFGTVLRDLDESGYDAEWDCIPAAAFGAPHLRYRVFIVAHINSRGLQRSNRRETKYTEQSSNSSWGRIFQHPIGGDGKAQSVAHAYGRRVEIDGSKKIFTQDGRKGHNHNRGSTKNGRRFPFPIEDAPNFDISGLEGPRAKYQLSESEREEPARRLGWWDTEPGVGRVVHGFSNRLDRRRHRLRIQALGNAVVPQVAEWLGNRIMRLERL